MAEFDYKQRPFSKKLTNEEYDRAVGRNPLAQSKRSRVYAFLRLPFHEQRARALRLGIWNATDQGLELEAQLREWASRAKAKGLVDELFPVTDGR